MRRDTSAHDCVESSQRRRTNDNGETNPRQQTPRFAVTQHSMYALDTAAFASIGAQTNGIYRHRLKPEREPTSDIGNLPYFFKVFKKRMIR